MRLESFDLEEQEERGISTNSIPSSLDLWVSMKCLLELGTGFSNKLGHGGYEEKVCGLHRRCRQKERKAATGVETGGWFWRRAEDSESLHSLSSSSGLLSCCVPRECLMILVAGNLG